MATDSRDRIIRAALWASVLLNTLGIVVFLPPALGYSTPFLPIAVPRIFAAHLGFMIALFGGVYAWLARRPVIDRPLLTVGAIGKLAFFGVTAAYAAVGDVPVSMALNATPDLVLGSVFVWWLRAS